MRNLKAFFDEIRGPLFSGAMTDGQVAGCTRLINACETGKIADLRQVAYLLATSYHETTALSDGHWHPTMQPVAEVGHGAGKPYGKPAGKYDHVYYGRGDVQLTWLLNYQRFGQLLKVDLEQFPDKALDPAISAQIIVSGMTLGWYTGKKLADYINAKGCDYVNARRIVNGINDAQLIAGNAECFEKALISGGYII